MNKTPAKPSTVTDASIPASDATTPGQAGTKTESKQAPKEIGGREGPDPTRYGDWEKAGRCVDF
jgi:hypothetical protein